MAHFAEIDSNNKVVRVLVVDNSQEHRGQEFLANDCNLGGTWIQTSYNANIRSKFATVEDTYDFANDRFIPPSPHKGWVLDENFVWQPTQQYPTDGLEYEWDESDLSWKLHSTEVTE